MELEEKEIGDHPLWLNLGVGSYGLCDRNYECTSCPVELQALNRLDTVAFLSEDEVVKLKQLPGGKKFCRYGSARFAHSDKPYLE